MKTLQIGFFISGKLTHPVQLIFRQLLILNLWLGLVPRSQPTAIFLDKAIYRHKAVLDICYS